MRRRPECWEMLEVLQSDVNLGICERRGSTGECRFPQVGVQACDVIAYICPASCSPPSRSSSRDASPPSASSASCASASPAHLAAKRLLDLQNDVRKHRRNTVPTCKRLQSFLGQKRWLQHQLADAELTGERQVSQVAMSATDLLITKTAF